MRRIVVVSVLVGLGVFLSACDREAPEIHAMREIYRNYQNQSLPVKWPDAPQEVVNKSALFHHEAWDHIANEYYTIKESTADVEMKERLESIVDQARWIASLWYDLAVGKESEKTRLQLRQMTKGLEEMLHVPVEERLP
jgi:hypothetical protein